jgi:hypothetical protein
MPDIAERDKRKMPQNAKSGILLAIKSPESRINVDVILHLGSSRCSGDSPGIN